MQEKEKKTEEAQSKTSKEIEKKQKSNEKSGVPDTLIVPAREEGFKNVFINENQWYQVRIADDKLDLIKYIAAYQTAPESAITHIAKVKDIRLYESKDKYLIEFEEEAEEIEKVPLKNPNQAPMGPLYGIKEKILQADCVAEAKYKF